MQAIILAAGKGTRMQSDLPKVLHRLGPRALLEHVLHHLEKLGITQPIVVVGYRKEQVMDYIQPLFPEVQFALQEEMLGTADAVRAAVPLLTSSEPTFMIYGDNPLFSPTTFRSLAAAHERAGAVLSLVTAVVPDPARYGRIVRGPDGAILRDVEFKDAIDEEKTITEINAGCYLADPTWLASALTKITPSEVTGEYYLTDLIELGVASGRPLGSYQLLDFREALGVNTLEDLHSAEKAWTALQDQSHV